MVQFLSLVKPQRSLPPGVPRDLCKRRQLEVGERLQLQLQGVGDEDAACVARGRLRAQWPPGGLVRMLMGAGARARGPPPVPSWDPLCFVPFSHTNTVSHP